MTLLSFYTNYICYVFYYLNYKFISSYERFIGKIYFAIKFFTIIELNSVFNKDNSIAFFII